MEENTNLDMQQKNDAPVGEEETFDTLIRGKYKAEFDAKVQKIIEGRLKSLHRENEALRMEQSRLEARQQQSLRQHRAAFDRLLYQAVRYGAQRAGEDLSRSLSGGRIAENGGAGRAAAVTHTDPSRLSAAERADIRRRVAKGEKVRFH